MSIKLSPEKTHKLQASIKRYAAENLDDDTPSSIDAVPQPLTTGDDSWGDTT